MPESRIDDLNPEQLRAATAAEGPVRTIAGAGTGKTKTLAARAAWLVFRESRGQHPAANTVEKANCDERYASLLANMQNAQWSQACRQKRETRRALR